LFFIVPVFDRVRMIDTRILTHRIREQEVISRNNVPVTIESVLFYRVINPEDAVMKIQDYAFAIAQLAQSALRDVVGAMTLDELLAEPEQIAKEVAQHVDKLTKAAIEATSTSIRALGARPNLDSNVFGPGLEIDPHPI
jgi:regulator of protease activity HflC (stomatin/prohibitin superfamily)